MFPASVVRTPFSRLLRRAFYAFVLTGLVGLVALGFISWEREKANARDNLTILSSVLASASQAFFDNLGNGLEPLGLLLRKVDVVATPEAARPYLINFQKRYPEVGAMAVIDPAGRMLVNTASPPGARLPDYRNQPDYMAPFQEALHERTRYTVGRPEYGQILHQWRFPFRYAVRDEAGRPLFVIQAAIPLETGIHFLRDIQLPAETLVGILREDGYQQTRWPVDDPQRVYSRPLRGPLMQALASRPGARRGHFTGHSPWMYTHDERIGAYSRLRNLPMYAYVSVPYRHLWEKWWDNNGPLLAVYLVFVAIFGSVAYWVTRYERYHSRLLLSQARRDPLTGLTNRAGADELLERQILDAESNGRPFSVLFFDLDRFKDINDTLGHGVGDRLLVEVGKRTSALLRQDDMLARLGGDEFLVILPGSTLEAGAHTAQRLVLAFESPFRVDEHRLKMSCSIGIAHYPEHGTNRETLLKHADTAMYEAKRLGRSGFACYEAELGERLKLRLAIESRIRDALQQAQFRLHYQPVVEIGSGRIISVEALLRWRDADGVEHSPAEFIPIAEESGLILPLGEWVLRTACAEARAWHDAGHDIRVAVNLSTRQFQDPELLGKVNGILSECGLPPSQLVLEITEGAAMLDPESSFDVLDRLRRLGIHIAIDDFGTGYSSLSYLKRIPADTVKIDKTFVDGVADEADDLAIVRAIVALGRALDKQIVAEGIETVAQKAALQREGCPWGQGYLFGKPVPAEALRPRLAEGFSTAAASDV